MICCQRRTHLRDAVYSALTIDRFFFLQWDDIAPTPYFLYAFRHLSVRVRQALNWWLPRTDISNGGGGILRFFNWRS